MNGSILLRLKTLDKVLRSLANEIGMESLSSKVQSILNVKKLTEHRSSPNQNKVGDP